MGKACQSEKDSGKEGKAARRKNFQMSEKEQN